MLRTTLSTATVHLSRRFAERAEKRRYTLVAAPRLRRGQRPPDAAFGGSSSGARRARARGTPPSPSSSVSAAARGPAIAGRSPWRGGTASSAS
jgi:hypothetical protein